MGGLDNKEDLIDMGPGVMFVLVPAVGALRQGLIILFLNLVIETCKERCIWPLRIPDDSSAKAAEAGKSVDFRHGISVRKENPGQSPQCAQGFGNNQKVGNFLVVRM